MLRRCIGALALLSVVLLGGCASRPPDIVEVEGFVLLDGLPLPKAKVRFFPQFDNAQEYIAQGVTDEKGHFTLTCHGQAGACAAENVVTVTEDEIPERLTPESARAALQAYLKKLKNRPIPPKYGNASETPINVTVTAGQKKYMIALTREHPL